MTYAVYGSSFVWSVVYEPSTAQLISIVFCAMAFMATGVMIPSFELFAQYDLGIYAMMLSPLRWAYGFLMRLHVKALGDAGIANPFLANFLGSFMEERGFPLR